MTFDELIKLTLAKMEEYTPFAESASIAAPEAEGFEVKPITSYITKMMEEAANDILMLLPLRLIRADEMNIITHEKLDNGVGILGIGDEFLRVHAFKMKSWDRPVHYAIDETSPLYVLQDNPYTMGNFHKPQVVIRKNISISPMNKALYYYSCPKEDKDREIEYSWQVSRFDKENIQDDLAEFYATKCASLVYQVYNMTEQVAKMEAELEKLIATR